jgi:two-component system sensor histidine kinase HydH
MAAVLAHEMRNPLASLKGNAQLLERSLPSGERAHRRAERVVGEAIRLETLVSGLLEFARTGELRRRPVPPVEVVRASVAALVHPQPAPVTIDDAGAPSLWSLDAERTEQVVTNLLENGLQAGPGPVRLSVEEREGELRLAVEDSGPGIPLEDLERIFEPFFTRRTRGTGLGLAVARRFVELHGGSLSASNRPGGGARFLVRIPRQNH